MKNAANDPMDMDKNGAINRRLPTKRRRLFIRMALVVLWIGLGVLLFVLNRGHTLLIDNQNIDDLRASDLITVTLDGEKPVEFFRGDRDIFRVGGGRHRLRVEYTDGTPPYENTFTLPLGPDMFLLSIPRMTSGAANAIEVFYRQQESRNVEEEEEIVIETEF
jgi:hypothetical protein